MPDTLDRAILTGLNKQVSAFGLGIFRFAFGLVVFQEIIFLFYFEALIFDPIPIIEPASPLVSFSLVLWTMASVCLTVGYKTQLASVCNYCFWVGFLVFTPLWHDFDGGFDQLMTSTSFLLIFIPSGTSFSIDQIRNKRFLDNNSTSKQIKPQVSILCYYLPLAISLGLLYFDAGIHKLSADFWMNGMGAWLPSTMPYYMSPIDMSPILNIKPVQQLIGYSLVLFQLSFIFLFFYKALRLPLLYFGILFHMGIIVSLNIYPFGFGMLVHFLLMIPFKWWKKLEHRWQTSIDGLSIPTISSNGIAIPYIYRYNSSKQVLIIRRFLILIMTLQLNTTLYYGVLGRLEIDTRQNTPGIIYTLFSNHLTVVSHLFLGITPHALYMDDHFEGYNRILGITYDSNGAENWLPFINREGRFLTPNWGRVHSMWANVAVRPIMDRQRLELFSKKVILFWGTKIGINVEETEFHIKLKHIQVTDHWVDNLRQFNTKQPWSNAADIAWENNEFRWTYHKDLFSD